MGDKLVVALTLDEFVGKPGRPIFKFAEREKMLLALKCVSDVSSTKNSVEAIYLWKPVIFVKGSDYLGKGLLPEEIEACKKVGAEIRFTSPCPPTTTEIIERIKCAS
jgi:bifunctional ADP-heptose synthase (sugar kinase/adenylyltransferase)